MKAFADFFIDRPVFAGTLSLLLLIAGCIAWPGLPVSEYPDVVPPTIVVSATYPGANPKTIADTVATPLEEQINGVENMLYTSSQSTSDGVMKLVVTFALGTNLDAAQVQVQNRVAQTLPKLPEEVQRLGVITQKSSPIFLMTVALTSPDHRYGPLYLSNYARVHVRDQLARLDGVGDVEVYGAGEYSLRIWLDPNRMASLSLTISDVVAAIRRQNVQVAAGALNAQPASGNAAFQLNINTQGRLITENEFSNIIVRKDLDGNVIHVRDIARVQLGANQYALRTLIDNEPGVTLPIYPRPGSNAIRTVDNVLATMSELKKSFPEGLDYRVVYDSTAFVRTSIKAVIYTLLEAILLVVLVVILFLQTWRASVIPLIAVPVSIVGTFAVMYAAGFSINTLSLFGLVLAIGIVVDDAIVVVENIQRHIRSGQEPRQAARSAMREVTGPIVSTALVLCAVFVPTAFMNGLTGQFYRQFAITIAISTVISAFNSLTLSPALAALLLKREDAPRDGSSARADRLLTGALRRFNRLFARGGERYVAAVATVLRKMPAALAVYVGLIALSIWGFTRLPPGFVPAQDKQYLVAFAQLPNAASLDRTDAVIRRMGEIAREQPGVAVNGLSGYVGLSINGLTNSSNAGIVFANLEPFEQRRDPSLTAEAIGATLTRKYSQIQDAAITVVSPPPVDGLGTIGGFRMQIEDRAGLGFHELQRQVENLLERGKQVPALASMFTTYQATVPQIDVQVDREKAVAEGIDLNDLAQTLQAYLGSFYINDFNRFGRTYQVNLAAESRFRREPRDIAALKIRNARGEMVPLGSFIEIRQSVGPERVMHYNGYVTADINGGPAPGYSSGQAKAAVERLAAANLPNGITFEWTELTYQQILAGNAALLVFPLCVLLVFLVLSATYESLSLPLSVILIVPVVLLSAIAGVWIAGQDNSIFTQISLIVLVGLACKNAILIVEFARENQEKGMDRRQAVLDAARLRLRPILMTSIAFIMGVLPLVVSRGAGAEMRHAIGVAVFSGMLGVTSFGLIYTPLFFVIVAAFVEKRKTRSPERAAHLAVRPE